jgi:hypothetical protein
MVLFWVQGLASARRPKRLATNHEIKEFPMLRPASYSLPLCLGLSLAASALAATPPPEVPFTDSPPGTLKESPATGITVAAIDVRFEKTSLTEVAGKLRLGTIAHQGDAGNSIYWLCYDIATREGRERLWVTSSGEMGGTEHLVTGISAQSLPGPDGTGDCPLLPGQLSPHLIGSSLWLGSSARSVTEHLGSPSLHRGAWQAYGFEGKVAGKCDPDGFDRTNWLYLRTETGAVTRLVAGQVTSC